MCKVILCIMLVVQAKVKLSVGKAVSCYLCNRTNVNVHSLLSFYLLSQLMADSSGSNFAKLSKVRQVAVCRPLMRAKAPSSQLGAGLHNTRKAKLITAAKGPGQRTQRTCLRQQPKQESTMLTCSCLRTRQGHQAIQSCHLLALLQMSTCQCS